MDNSLVSILIPVYNRAHLIEETLMSALNQTYTNIEIIIVDNHSTDNTWEIIKNFAKQDNRIKTYQNKSNIGPVKNWQRCIDKASGKYGKILWSDDLIDPEFLKITIPYLINNDVGFVFTATEIFIDGTNKKSMHYLVGETGTFENEKYINGILFEKGYPVSPGCALFRLKDLKKNLLLNIPNKINSDFSKHAIGNDLLIFLLTAYNYKKFAFVKQTLSFFRAHKESISIQSEDGKLPLFYMLTKAYFIERLQLTHLYENLNHEINNLLHKYNYTKYGIHNISSFYLNNTNYCIKDPNPSLSFSNNFNKFYNQISELGNKQEKYIIYGNGTISKTIQKLISEQILGYVDINDINHHPKNLITMQYDKILISVLGREKEILSYLTEELNINRDKIVTFNI